MPEDTSAIQLPIVHLWKTRFVSGLNVAHFLRKMFLSELSSLISTGNRSDNFKMSVIRYNLHTINTVIYQTIDSNFGLRLGLALYQGLSPNTQD